eukprot:1161364-Pelagomonas_calceolata.AAC.6
MASLTQAYCKCDHAEVLEPCSKWAIASRAFERARHAGVMPCVLQEWSICANLVWWDPQRLLLPGTAGIRESHPSNQSSGAAQKCTRDSSLHPVANIWLRRWRKIET